MPEKKYSSEIKPGDNQIDIKNLFENILHKIGEMNEKIEGQNNKIKLLEEKLSDLKKEGPVDIFRHETTAPPPPPPPPTAKAADKIEQILQFDKFTEKEGKPGEIYGGEGSEPSVETPTPAEYKKAAVNLEEKIGGKWFAKIGIAILILGVSFFLKYAFDNNWIGPTGRVIMGILAGLGLLAFGEKTIRKYNLYGQIVSGGGLAILYLSIYAAFNFYHLISSPAAFAFMSLVTAIGIALALRYDAASLITVSVAGGFVTPYLASSGDNHQVALFSYIALLDLAVLAVSIFKKWRWLNVLGLFGTFIIFSGWYSAYYSVSQILSTLFFATLFFIIYSISPLIYNLYKKENSTGFEQVMTLAAGFIYFGLSYNLLDPAYHIFLGLFTMVLALYYFLWAYLVKSLTPEDKNLYNFLAFFSVGFITVAIPVQFKKFVITMCWAVESVLLLYLGVKLRGDKSGETIKSFGLVVLVMAISRTLFIDQVNYQLYSLIFVNKVFLSSVLVIAAVYLIAYLFKKFYHDSKNNTVFLSDKLIPILMIMASFLTIFSISREIIIYHNNLVKIEYKSVDEKNQIIRQERGNISEYLFKVDSKSIVRLHERRDAFLTLFWLMYAAVIMVFGVYKKLRYLIISATLINVAVLAKILMADLWQVETYFRVFISFLGVAFSYLAAYLFKEYKTIAGVEEKLINPKKLFAIFIIAANVLTIFAFSREINVYFQDKISVVQKEMFDTCNQANAANKFKNNYSTDNSCRTQYLNEIKTLTSKSSVAISLYWLIYSIILIVIGFAKKYKWVRIGGILLLLVAILKLLFIDLWSLGQLYRIIASISLGMVLMGVSFAYQKYKHVFQEIIK